MASQWQVKRYRPTANQHTRVYLLFQFQKPHWNSPLIRPKDNLSCVAYIQYVQLGLSADAICWLYKVQIVLKLDGRRTNLGFKEFALAISSQQQCGGTLHLLHTRAPTHARTSFHYFNKPEHNTFHVNRNPAGRLPAASLDDEQGHNLNLSTSC